MKFRCIFWVIRLQSLQKCFGRIFTIFACKSEVVCCEVQAHFGCVHLAINKRSSGYIFSIFASENKAVCMKFRLIFDVFALHALYKMFWAHFHDVCVQKRSDLRWSSDWFWKFSSCKFHSKSCGHNFSICASRNEAVFCEVQTHFESTLPASFTEKLLGTIPRFLRPKTKLFAVKFMRILVGLCLQVLQKTCWAQFLGFCVQKRSCLLWNSDAFWKFSACKLYRKSYARNSSVFVLKTEAACCEVQTHFGSVPLARLIKKLWAHFHDLCVTQTNILDFNIL